MNTDWVRRRAVDRLAWDAAWHVARREALFALAAIEDPRLPHCEVSASDEALEIRWSWQGTYAPVRGRLPEEEACALAAEVCRVTRVVHAATDGRVRCGPFYPSNIGRGADGLLVLGLGTESARNEWRQRRGCHGPFALACARECPESVLGLPLTPASDVFWIAELLDQVLVGSSSFPKDMASRMEAVARGSLPAPPLKARRAGAWRAAVDPSPLRRPSLDDLARALTLTAV